MNSIILISCFLAYAIAQPTITQLTSGTAATSALAVTATADLAETTFEYYSIQLTANTQTVTIDFDADPTGTSECGYLYFYYSVRGIPCGDEWSEETGNLSPCRHGEYGYAYATSTSVTFYAGGSGIYGEYAFAAGATLYISVGKSYSYYDKVCPFSIKATVTNCTTSEVAVYATSSTAACVAVTDQTFPLHTTTVINGQQVHRFPVAQEVGHIRIEINSTEYIYAYGGYNYPVNYAGYGADCSASSYNEGDYYSLALTCSQPKAGWFYLTLQPYYSSDTGINATVAVTQQVCGAQGGIDCSFYVLNYTTSDTYNRTIKAYNSSQDEVAPFDAYFVNFPAGTLANVNFTVCNGPQYVYFIYRKDGYPDYYSDSYVNDGQYTSLSAFECATIVVRPEDTYVGGRFYVAIQNSNSGFAASYQISKAAAVIDTSASQTTGDTTTAGSGAAALVAPVMMMILALIALLF